VRFSLSPTEGEIAEAYTTSLVIACMSEGAPSVGSRYFIPDHYFPEEDPRHTHKGKRGWFATIRDVRTILNHSKQIIFHCDGDQQREVAIKPIDDFVASCEPVPTHEDAHCCEYKKIAQLPPGWFAQNHGSYKSYSDGQPRKKIYTAKAAWELWHTEQQQPPPANAGESSSTTSLAPRKRPGELPPVAAANPPRKRLVRLPNPEDEKVGKRIKIAFGGRDNTWYTAQVLEAVPCLSHFNAKATMQYRVRYDIDAKTHLLDLNTASEVCWEWLRVDEKVDEYDEKKGGGPEPPSTPPALVEVSQARPSLRTSIGKRQRQGATCQPEAASTSLSLANVPCQRRPDDVVGQLVADAIDNVLARVRDEAAAAADDLPVMRQLRSIEFFAGSARLSFALRQQHKWRAAIHDWDKDAVEWEEHGESYIANKAARLFRSEDFVKEITTALINGEAAYDYLHFSIDCRSFSTLGFAGQGRNETNDFLGEHPQCHDGNKMFAKTLTLIETQLERNPHLLFTIEQPFTGKLKDHHRVRSQLELSPADGGLGATRCVVDYCWFHDRADQPPFRKRTIIWTNSPALIHELGEHQPPAATSRYLCERSTPCPYYRSHRSVQGNTAEATPFPRLLAALIARAITHDASPQRWRPVRLPCGSTLDHDA
jgi:hypothetical protein